MKLLIFGSNSQIGLELSNCMPGQIDAVFLDRSDVDVIDPHAISHAIHAHQPDAVINVAAFTEVDLAETQEDVASLINGSAPEAMAAMCAQIGIPFLHVSTDYVFDGSGHAPRKPDDITSPLNAYGRSKRLGEEKIKISGSRYLILRTSWVFSVHRKNFFKTMLRLGRDNVSLNVVADQFGGPTPASAIADVLLHAAEDMVAGKSGGVYHFSGEPDVSWSEFARYIMMAAGLPCKIVDIQSGDYPLPAIRPFNSRLDCSTFERDFQIRRPDWREAVNDILKFPGVDL